ncbi:ABC transporter permease, partial [Aquifex sp.]
MKYNFFISWKLFLERKRQSFVATLGVIIGTAAFIVMSSMVNGFQKFFLKEALNINGHVKIMVEPTSDKTEILEMYYGDGIFKVLGYKPKEEKDSIRNYREIVRKYERDRNVVGVAPHLVSNGVIIYGVKEKAATLVGIFPEKEERTLSLSEYLVYKRLDEMKRDRSSVILGIKLAHELGIYEAGKKVSLISPTGEVYRLKVIDFLNTGITEIDKSRVYLHIKKLQDILDRAGEVNEVVVKLRDYNLSEYYAEKLSAETGYKAESWQESFRNFLSIFKIQKIITSSVIFAILTVSGFGIFNIIMMTVLEKKRDIAILKAMGYEPYDLILIFTLQGLIIGVLGGIIGNVVGFFILEWLETIKIELEGIIRAQGFILDRSVVYHVYGFGFAVLTSFL